MEIVSFTGKSGTGKSYQATRIARKKNIEAIIDDGLLIYKNRIVAGTSAKKATTKAAAMRATLFACEEQRTEVIEMLEVIKPKRMMVLGTSDRMVDWITDALSLPRASERLYIYDVTTDDERNIARESRLRHGEHVIPAPVGELKREFAGYFMHPVRMIRGMTMSDGPVVSGQATDRTVVRPSFSYYGSFKISDKCLEDIISIAVSRHASCIRVMDYAHNGNSHALNMEIDIKIKRRQEILDRIKLFQREVRKEIEMMTSFQVNRINIKIKDISLPFDKRKNRNKK